ncbi:thylakoid lumenal 29 kDa protein, chloroplastic isoform X3 [Gossypium hirsutum]|uniref:Thylakoid lumenal 29 kDa protein, chloroplastic isoform X3 n=1 Tax=Gossypium hirsutum TaxID=3635 RepID=A0ABM3A858_GOSHI|nr:thylakoid lumenal 29 kDa protein, chloroplastic-like isoform X3 [Gossypium hirsutum]
MEAMRVSFLSTTPLVSLVPVSDPSLNSPSIAATRYLTRPVAIRCSNNNTQSVDVCGEYGFHRRDVLKCIGASVGMELLASSGSWVEMASAADLIQRRQRSEFLSSIKETLAKAMTVCLHILFRASKVKTSICVCRHNLRFRIEFVMLGNPDLIPSMLTLALNDAMTYDKATKSGGSNGSIRFSSELSRPENKGLAAAMSLLDEAKKEIDSYSKGGPISYADLIQYAAQAAVKSTFLAAAIRKCGGNEDKGRTLYAAYGSSGQVFSFLLAYFISLSQNSISSHLIRYRCFLLEFVVLNTVNVIEVGTSLLLILLLLYCADSGACSTGSLDEVMLKSQTQREECLFGRKQVCRK